jgi:hypothetical protein
MDIGMEQLIWAIIFIIFIIVTALKNRARKKPGTATTKPTEVKNKAKPQQEKLGKYLEEIFGIEIPKPEPQKITAEKEKPEPLREKAKPKTKPELEKEEFIGKFESPLIKEFEEREKSVIPEKKELYQVKFPWGSISRENLPSAIIFSEIIGPPISKRKSHRLF